MRVGLGWSVGLSSVELGLVYWLVVSSWVVGWVINLVTFLSVSGLSLSGFYSRVFVVYWKLGCPVSVDSVPLVVLLASVSLGFVAGCAPDFLVLVEQLQPWHHHLVNFVVILEFLVPTVAYFHIFFFLSGLRC